MKLPRCWCGAKLKMYLQHTPTKGVTRCTKCKELRIYDENKTEDPPERKPGEDIRPAYRPKKK